MYVCMYVCIYIIIYIGGSINGGTPISGNLHIHIIYWTHNCHLYAYNRNQDRIGDFNGLFGEKYKKTSLKIELLMDPWKSAASPVLPLDISWLNPQQATFKGQMIHILCVEPKEVIWGYCTRQGGSYFIFHSLTLFHEWPGFQTLRWVLAFSACQSYLLRFFMRTHLILQLVWG